MPNIRFKLNIYFPYYFRKFLRLLTKYEDIRSKNNEALEIRVKNK